jgi:hypothetical protein
MEFFTRVESHYLGEPRVFAVRYRIPSNKLLTLTTFVFKHDGSSFITDLEPVRAGVAPNMSKEQYVNLFEDIDRCHGNTNGGDPLLGFQLQGSLVRFPLLEDHQLGPGAHVHHTMLHVLSKTVEHSRTPVFMGSLVEVMQYVTENTRKVSVSLVSDITTTNVFSGAGADYQRYVLPELNYTDTLIQLFQARDRAVDDIQFVSKRKFPASDRDDVMLEPADYFGNSEMTMYVSLGFVVAPGPFVHTITDHHTSGFVVGDGAKPGYTALTTGSVPTNLIKVDTGITMRRPNGYRRQQLIVPDYLNFLKTNASVYIPPGDSTYFRAVTSVYHGSFTFDHKNYFQVPPGVVITIPMFPSSILMSDAYKFSEELMNRVRQSGSAAIVNFLRRTAARETPMAMNDSFFEQSAALPVGKNKDSQLPLSSLAAFVENMNDRPELENFEVCSCRGYKSVLRYRTYFPGMRAPNIKYTTDKTYTVLSKSNGYTGVVTDPESGGQLDPGFPHTHIQQPTLASRVAAAFVTRPPVISSSAETRTSLSEIADGLAGQDSNIWLTANSCFASSERYHANTEGRVLAYNKAHKIAIELAERDREEARKQGQFVPIGRPLQLPRFEVSPTKLISSFFEAGLHNIRRNKISLIALNNLSHGAREHVIAAIANRLINGNTEYATAVMYDTAMDSISVDDCGQEQGNPARNYIHFVRELLPAHPSASADSPRTGNVDIAL